MLAQNVHCNRALVTNSFGPLAGLHNPFSSGHTCIEGLLGLPQKKDATGSGVHFRFGREYSHPDCPCARVPVVALALT